MAEYEITHTHAEEMRHTHAEVRYILRRLAYLRAELRAERISYGELAELQGLAEHIDPGDTELLEAAGVPEHANDTRTPVQEESV